MAHRDVAGTLGDGYIQAGQSIDTALLGRFNLHLDMEYGDPAVTVALSSETNFLRPGGLARVTCPAAE